MQGAELTKAPADATESPADDRDVPRKQRHRSRSVLAGFLVVLTSLVFTLAITAGWTRRTLFNTGQYVRTVAPLPEHDSVTRVLSERIAGEILLLIDVQTLAEEALPPRAQILAGPIAGATEDFVRDEVRSLLDSDQFAEFWVNANRFAHTQIMAVLKGDGGAVLTTDEGTVTLNLLPVMNEVLVRVEEKAGGLLGKDVDLPEITSGEVPDEARAKLEAALGVDVPENLGEVVIFQSDKLAAAQDALTMVDRLVIVLLVAAALLIALTLWVSARRRRTLIQLCTGILLGLVLVRRLVMYMQDQVVDLARTENQDAAQAIVDDLMRNFFRLTTFLIIVGLVTIAIAVLTGPYPFATRFRGRSRALGSSLTNWTQDRAHDDATTEWVGAHSDALKIGGAVFLVIALLVFEVSWLGFFLLAGIVGFFELFVYRVSHEVPHGTEPTPT
jgi:hypothetical protein